MDLFPDRSPAYLRDDVAPDQASSLDRKRIVVLLRSVVIATSAYLVFTGEETFPIEGILYVILFAASNVALALAPRRLFEAPHFGPLLLLADTAIILFGLSWSHGLSQDLLLVYFFTIFLLTVGETLGQIAVGSALIAGGYGYWLWANGSAPLEPEAWVRLPFFFLVAIFYASLIEQLKRERRRRQEAEQQNQHLRLMLDLAGVFSEAHATREFVRGIGRFIEGTCPGLECTMVLHEVDRVDEPGVTTYPLRAHGKHYGVLCVRAGEGRAILEREEWLCRMVAHSAAGALYAAEQSDAAREASEAKDQFIANVSHEFRTPLHAILGYVDVLGAVVEGNDDEMAHESVERLRVNACRLQHLLEELLSFAEIRAGRRAIWAEKVSIRRLIGDLVPITRELLSGKPVSLSWEVPEKADELWTDARKLQRVLACVLSNAAKFTEQGRISVSAERLYDGSVSLEVADTGIGMSEEDLKVIFDEFRQVDGSFTRRYGGIGLGLTLARELVMILGGQLDLESIPGGGTKVTLRIPNTIPKPIVQSAPAADPHPERVRRLAAAQ